MGGGLAVGGVQPVIRQLRHRGGHPAGDGDDGRAFLPQGLHALDDLRRLPGIGYHNGQIVLGGVFGLEHLDMPVVVDLAGLVQPEELQIQVPGGLQGSAQAEQQHRPGVPQQVHTGLKNIGVDEAFGILQRHDVLVGDLIHDVVQAVGLGDLLASLLLVEPAHRYLTGHRLAELLVPREADALAHPDHGGRRGEGLFRQLVDGQAHGLPLVGQQVIGHRALGGAHGVLALSQPDQRAFHAPFSSQLRARASERAPNRRRSALEASAPVALTAGLEKSKRPCRRALLPGRRSAAILGWYTGPGRSFKSQKFTVNTFLISLL